MKKVEFICTLTEYERESELSADDKNLITEARASMVDAYAPYSHFKVGAAVLLENGTVVRGNNQENASYPIGLCAERVAIFSAGANFPGMRIKAVAIAARSDHFPVDNPVPPCGACRQAISEYEQRYGGKIKIIMTGESGRITTSDDVESLLPFQFKPSNLKRK